jgi:hypothetical protein
LSYEYSQLVIADPPVFAEAILKVTVAVWVLPLELHEIEPPILELEGAAAFETGIL